MAKRDKSQDIRNTLVALAKRRGGRISPAAVVAAARPAASPLHSQFCWDDTKAARLYRLQQARHILKIQIEYVTHPATGREITVPMFASLRSDRDRSGDDDDAGSYHLTLDVLKNKDTRRQLLDEFKSDVQCFITKYEHLTEAAAIIAAMRTSKKG